MGKRKPQAWLVYEEGEVYDGGHTPLLVAPTEALARHTKADIDQVVAGVRARIGRLPDPFEDHIGNDEYSARVDKRDQMLKRVRWPHGLKREPWNWNFTVAVMPLPLVQEQR